MCGLQWVSIAAVGVCIDVLFIQCLCVATWTSFVSCQTASGHRCVITFLYLLAEDGWDRTLYQLRDWMPWALPAFHFISLFHFINERKDWLSSNEERCDGY